MNHLARYNQRQASLRIFVWLALEVLFNLAGTDNLADYSEFVFERCYSSAAIVQLA